MQVLAKHDCQIMFTHYNGGMARGKTMHGSELGYKDLNQLQQLRHSIHDFFGQRAAESLMESAATVKKSSSGLHGAPGGKFSAMQKDKTTAKTKATAIRIAEKAAREAKSHFLLGTVPANPNRTPIPPRLPRSQREAQSLAPVTIASRGEPETMPFPFQPVRASSTPPPLAIAATPPAMIRSQTVSIKVGNIKTNGAEQI